MVNLITDGFSHIERPGSWVMNSVILLSIAVMIAFARMSIGTDIGRCHRRYQLMYDITNEDGDVR